MKKAFLSVLPVAASAVMVFAVSGCHSTSAASSSSNPDFPPVCNAYIERVQACVGQVAGPKDPGQVQTAKSTLESRIQEYGRTHSRDDLVQTCTRAWNNFNQTAATYGCR